LRRGPIATPAFDKWLDEFFASYYRWRPVNATFIGVHDYDYRLPDYSENAIGDLLADMQSQLEGLDALPDEPLSSAQQVDRRLASGHLRIQCWEIESGRYFQRNPILYCGEAIFGVMSLFLHPVTPLSDRVAAATARMQAIPELLEQGRQNIRQVPLPWAQHARDECTGALKFFGEDAINAAGGAADGGYRRAVEQAAHAFRAFHDVIEAQIAESHVSPDGCGHDALHLHLENAHCIDTSPTEIADYAMAELRAAQSRLATLAPEFGERDPGAVLAQLENFHPDVDGYYDRYEEMWASVRTLAKEKDLLTWPDFPIRYGPQPDWARRAAPHLYFLNYRAPAAFDKPPVHEYLTPPLERPDGQTDMVESLRANNDSVIKLNHVVHHGGIGHHVQNWHAYRAESRIAQVAAVDCASRIAMNCGGTMAEGWACYATDLVGEAGGMTALESFAEVHTRTRMSTRALVDIGFHTNVLSFDEAVTMYMQEAGMSADGARYETTRNSMFPGSAVMYLVGCDRIHQLRAELASTMGSDFDLREFHDEFLSHGSIPVALIAELMTEAHNQG
jgi:uncharacterized protein (DUF885 family)